MPVSAALGQITVDSWKKALATWKENAAKSAACSSSSSLRRARRSTWCSRTRSSSGGAHGRPVPSRPTRRTARQGYVVLGYDLAPVAWFKPEANDQKAAAVTKAALYTGAVGALFALIGTVLAIFQGLSISKPLKQLAWKADQIARGDLDARVEVTPATRSVCSARTSTSWPTRIAILLQQTAEKAKIEQELEVAKAIRRRWSERRAGEKEHADVRRVLSTGGARRCDWWTWAELVGGKILVVIGDVTGHGVPSAMITAAAKASCDVARYVHNDDVTVTTLLEIMNHAIFESAQRRFVMTCFASIIDTKARTITYANAGHNFPYLFRPG